MTHSLTKAGRTLRSDYPGHKIVISPATGITGSYTTGLTMRADNAVSGVIGGGRGFVVDKIVLNCMTPDAASNVTVTLKINGVEMPFHFPGTADKRATKTRTLDVGGNIVVHPGQSVQVKASTTLQASVSLHGWEVPYTELCAMYPGGSLPNVASTNTVATGGLVAGVAKAIVPAVAGKCVEILGFFYTGHNFNAAKDYARIGFWDGSTGTFAANSNRFFKAFAMGADNRYAPEVLVCDTQGCIQGDAGLGVYVDSTVNLVAKWTVNYDGQTSNLTLNDTLTFSGGGTAKLIAQTDSGATGSITFQMMTGAVPADDETFVDEHTGDGTVNGTPAEGYANGDYVVMYRYVPAPSIETWTVAYDGQSTSFLIGETLTFSSGSTAKLIAQTDSGATGTITFQMIAGVIPADNETITGGYGGDGTVNGTPSVKRSYVGAPDVVDPTGQPSQKGGGQKFWCYTEADPVATSGYSIPIFGGYEFNIGSITGTFAVGEVLTFVTPAGTARLTRVDQSRGYMRTGIALTGTIPAVSTTMTGGTSSATATATSAAVAIGVPAGLAKFSGYAASLTSADEVVNQSFGLGIGIGPSLNVMNLIGTNSDGAASPAEVSNCYVEDELDIEVGTAARPSFYGTCLDVTKTDRCYLTWGLLDGNATTSTTVAPTNIARFA